MTGKTCFWEILGSCDFNFIFFGIFLKMRLSKLTLPVILSLCSSYFYIFLFFIQKVESS